MNVVKRTSCRAILLTPDNEVLLIKVSNDNWTGWITPGGGMDAGESETESLRRELVEELGFALENEAPKVWRRFHRYPWNGKLIEQHENYFLVRTAKFDPGSGTAWTEVELKEFRGMRWWSLAEIAATTDEFSPRAFADLLQELITHGAPADPIEVGV